MGQTYVFKRTGSLARERDNLTSEIECYKVMGMGVRGQSFKIMTFCTGIQTMMAELSFFVPCYVDKQWC